MKTSFKTSSALKTISVSLLFACLAVTSFPARSDAQLLGGVVHDPLHAVITAANLVFSGKLNVKEFILDPLAWSVKSVALHAMTKSVVNWANSGFNGSPAFVQDLNQTLLSTSDAEANRFIDQFVNSGSLQNIPWKDEVAQSVLSGYLRSTSKDGFALENPYTLDQVSVDPQATVNGDWSVGGLDAWMSLVLNPANSPRGLLHVTQNRLATQVGGARENKISELNWSNGFNSFRGKCPSSTSGPLGGSASVGGTPVLSFDGSSGQTTGTRLTTLSSVDTCAGQPILTPGSLISQAVNKYAVDTGADQYVAADEIGEIVNVLMGQLVGNVLGGGGLSGLSAPTSGGGASYIDTAAKSATDFANQAARDAAAQSGNSAANTGTTNTGGTSANIDLSLSQAFFTTISNQQNQVIVYRDAWTSISNSAAAAKAALGGATCTSVDQVLSNSGSSVSNANSVINQIGSIIKQMTDAIAQDVSQQSAAIATASAAYQKLQSSPIFPTVSDVNYASAQSDGSPGTLVDQMNQIVTSKVCPS